MPILNNVHNAIRQYQLCTAGDTVVVGVSGGTDSLALLHMLLHLRDRLGIRLVAATVDHGWRGEQSASEAAWVVQTATAWGVPAVQTRLDVPSDDNLESGWRRGRFAFFARVCAEHDADTVMLAHHADDQAETVLMRLLTGSGQRGVAGMAWRAPMPYHPHLQIARPLLATSRAEIEAYCAEHDLHPIHDPSNQDTRFLRNRLRHEVLPYLETVRPDVKTALQRFAEVAAVESDYLDRVVVGLLTDYPPPIPRAVFNGWHVALQRRVLVALVARVNPTARITSDQVEAARNLALTGTHGAKALFGDGVQLRVEYATLLIEQTTDVTPRSPLPHPLRADTPTQWGAWQITLSTERLAASHGLIYLPADAQLRVRARQTGDRLALPGMDGQHQKLSDYLINRKVPQAERDHIALLVSGGEILAILHPNFGIVAHPYHQAHNGSSPYWVTVKQIQPD